MKSTNKNNYLGMAWEVINPLIQIAIYWFAFGFGIRQGRDVEIMGASVSFILWMIPGIIVWFFFYHSTIQASKSIYTRLKMLSKMNFPMSVIPSFVIFSKYYVHLIMVIIVLIVMQLSGFFISFYFIQIIYFTLAVLAFTYALALITSTLATIVRDVQMFLQSSLRLLLYLSGILWPITALPESLHSIMKLNPLYYIIEGYRASFLGLGWYFVDQWQYTLYFWLVTMILFLIGSSLHIKFRRHFIDFL